MIKKLLVKVKQFKMKNTFLKVTTIVALVVASYSNVYGQDNNKKENKAPAINSLETNNATVQKNAATINWQRENNPFDKYDATRADFNNTNNYSARTTSSSSSSSSSSTDVGFPANSPFQLGADITGSVQNSINQITGKVAFSVPLASISSGTCSYSLNLGYDGQSSFKQGKEQNKYSPTSVVGTGWSLPIPKIVVNNKKTTTQDDDDFYLIDGATNSKLICILKTKETWGFVLEKYSNWKITYSTIFDSWTVIKEDGKTYYFGQSGSSNSRERVSNWGNWIGDSSQTPTGHSTIVWNISEIEDQWNNSINFKYELVEGKQNTSQIAYKHTKASYLKEITSSRGSKIKLNYDNKTFNEYYEPYRSSINEPDAYQERYEKKYLKDVEVYSSNNQLVTSYDLASTLYTASTNNSKRYLTSITQTSHSEGQAHSLPSQIFEYHTSGTFKGGLKKVTYPSGGSVTYKYQNKYLFSNGANKYQTSPTTASGYIYYGTVVRDNYSLFVLRTENPVSGNKHNFKFIRYSWNGQQWDYDEFNFPHLVEDLHPNTTSQDQLMKELMFVFEEDFYGIVYDNTANAYNAAYIYLFHRNKNGNSWHEYIDTKANIGDHTPSFISGDNFVALGGHGTGYLNTYVWNGSTWNFKQINQGVGQYYYAATNNFILSLDEDGGNDMVTGVSHEDNYYIHYLDAEKKWQTKSWSAFADPYIVGIEKPSNFFPGNSIAGFVADNNPELFLRWDTNYNLIAVDDVLGGYNDAHSLQPVNNSMFTLVWWWDKSPTKTARFNGVNWNVSDFSNADRAAINFGLDFMIYKNDDTDWMRFRRYLPNTNNWVAGNVTTFPWYTSFQVSGINSEFFVMYNKIYKLDRPIGTWGGITHIGSLQYDNDFTYSDGLSHMFVREVEHTDYGGSASSEFKQGTFYYINKETGALSSINMGAKEHLKNNTSKLGGYTPFMSPRSIWTKTRTSCSNDSCSFSTYLYRIIDDKFNQLIYDIVVSSIELDDENDNVRKINYSYNNPNSLLENNATYYGEVIVENKGFGSSSIGKIKKIFNTGTNDIQMLGLQLEEYVLDTGNYTKRKTTNVWEKNTKAAHNGSFQVDLSHYITLKSKKEEIFLGATSLENLTTYSYNSKGQLASSSTVNSKGETERQDIKYAHEQYSFVENKNMLTDAYETTTKLNNEIVDVKRNIWTNTSGKVHIKEKWSGPNTSKLRLDTEVTNIDNLGNLLEATDGKNIYNSILLGYSNLYEVASISNAKYQDVINELDVTYSQLQNLNTTNLKTELMKLYSRLPNAMISLTFYDDNGRVINRINERQEQTYIYYDTYGRLDYITDGYGNMIERKSYNYGN